MDKKIISAIPTGMAGQKKPPINNFCLGGFFSRLRHIRRKFFEAEAGDSTFRNWLLRKIRHLFMLERIAWARSPEERLKIRQEKEEPIKATLN